MTVAARGRSGTITIVPATRSPRRWKRDESAIAPRPTAYPVGSASAARSTLRSAAAAKPMGLPVVVTTRNPHAIFPGEAPRRRLPRHEVPPLRREHEDEDEARPELRGGPLHVGHRAAERCDEHQQGEDEEHAVAEENVEEVREHAAGGPGDAVAEHDVLGRLDGDAGVERGVGRVHARERSAPLVRTPVRLARLAIRRSSRAGRCPARRS